MIITPIKTRKLLPPKDDLLQVLDQSIKSLEENSILAISSKIVSIGEGRCIPLGAVPDKDELIKQEADFYLSRDYVPGKWLMHTVTNNLMIGTAGIDESNANGHYILWPKNPKKSAKKIHDYLTQKFGIHNLGIIITDSHSIPLRRGVVGISLAYYGFAPLLDYRGKEDLFGRELHVSQTNFADGLAAAAVVSMGEGDEQTPIVLLTELPNVTFTTKNTSRKKFSSLEVSMEEDLYNPFFTLLPWEKGGLQQKIKGNIILVKHSRVNTVHKQLVDTIEQHGFRCFVADNQNINQIIDFFQLSPHNTIIHPRTAGIEVQTVLAKLAKQGFRIINSVQTLKKTSNKYLSQIHARKNNIPAVDSFLVSKTNTKKISQLLKKYHEIVIKPEHTQGGGKNIYKIDQYISEKELSKILMKIPGDSALIQPYINYQKIIRTIVLNFKAVPESFVYVSPNGNWKTLFYDHCQKYSDRSGKLSEFAEKVAKAFDSQVAFIDFFELNDGAFVLNEINTASSFETVEQVTGVPIYSFIAQTLISKFSESIKRTY